MTIKLLKYCDENNIKYENTCLELLFYLYNQVKNNAGFIYDLSIDKCIYITPSIKRITGHFYKELYNKGILFLKSLIHPSDYFQVANDVSSFIRTEEYYKRCEICNLVKFLSLKVKHKEGSWVQININIIKISKTHKCLPDILIGFIQKSEDIDEKELFLIHDITPREKEVLKLIASGDSAKIISQKLNVCENTVISHRKHLIEKFNAKNTAELIKKAIKADII